MTYAAAVATDAHAEVLRVAADRFFDRQNRYDPLNATLLGLTEYDALLPDLRPDADAAAVAEFRAVAEQARALPTAELSDAGRTDAAVLAWMADAAADDAQHVLWEANASAAGYVSPLALVFQAVPATPLGDDAARSGLLQRLSGLATHFDTLGSRWRDAADVGRVPTAAGVAQAVTQLRAYLDRPLADDVLLPAGLAGHRDRAAAVVEAAVRPAMRRLLATLESDLLPVARGDDAVGIGAVPGGEAGYRAAVARHTSLPLTPEQTHRTGLEVLERLADDWSAIGREALGITDPAEVRAALRADPALRFESREQIVQTVSEALARAEAAAPRMLPDFGIGPCTIEEIDPEEAESAALAYYRPPSDDGSRRGAHCVLTVDPTERFRFEYEALAFHESVPGHHLSLASAQTLTHLHPYRRHVDAQLCAYVEGWGLYAERLADEFGLYSSPVARLGMVSFDALRACRLVVDTGMHAFGWSRGQAVEFMRTHTATPAANVRNEIDRYIGWPGQALAYMTGKREIVRLREQARDRLGDRFDVVGFHGAVLGEGPLPLGVLGDVVDRWVTSVA